jgi:hypothetical protein
MTSTPQEKSQNSGKKNENEKMDKRGEKSP